MAKMNYKNRPVHVYVMRSVDGLVKVGIAENVVTRADNEYLAGEKKKISAICYSTEKLDMKTARIYEAALLGFHKEHIINGSEWLTTQWRTVVKTLNSMLDGKTEKININEEGRRDTLHDEFMKNKGYTKKYFGKWQSIYYLKNENDICKLVHRIIFGEEGIEVCSLPIEEMMDYLTENNFTLVKKL